MIKNIKDLEKSLSLAEGTLEEAIKSNEEKEIDISGLEILKKTDYQARIDNLKNEFKIAGLEIGVKTAREKFGLDFQGKTIDNFAEALKAKVLSEAKIEPDKKVTELTTDLNTMKANFEKATKDFQDLQKNFHAKENERKINDNILSKIPDNILIPKEDLLTIFKSKNKIEISDTGAIIFKNGNDEILKNQTTLNPLNVEDVMTNFILPYLKTTSGGSGAGDGTGNAKNGTLDAFAKEMTDKGVKENTQAFNLEMQKRIKDGTLKI